MTLPLELGGIQDPEIRRAFEEISKRFPLQSQDLSTVVLLLAVTGTARKVAFGANTVTFTASTTSATTTVTHGLGATPVAVLANFSTGAAAFLSPTAIGSTSFGAIGYAPFGAATGTFPFTWLAVG